MSPYTFRPEISFLTFHYVYGNAFFRRYFSVRGESFERSWLLNLLLVPFLRSFSYKGSWSKTEQGVWMEMIFVRNELYYSKRFQVTNLCASCQIAKIPLGFRSVLCDSEDKTQIQCQYKLTTLLIEVLPNLTGCQMIRIVDFAVLFLEPFLILVAKVLFCYLSFDISVHKTNHTCHFTFDTFFSIRGLTT